MSRPDPLFGDLPSPSLPPPPRPTHPGFRGLPDLHALRQLQERPQWVSWDFRLKYPKGATSAAAGSWVKKPLQPSNGDGASSSDPTTWATYAAAAFFSCEQKCAGVGFVLAENDGFGGFDLDKVRDPDTGRLETWVAEIIGYGETYAEVSPSGKGVRIFALGEPERTVKLDAAHVEIYRAKRFLTVTGQHLPGTPDEIRSAPRTLAALLDRVNRFKAAQEDAARAARLAAGIPERKPRRAADGAAPSFFDAVNQAAFEDPEPWVSILFNGYARAAPNGGWRVSSADLCRDLEEDLSIHPMGFVDHGVADMGDEREGRRSAIDLVREWGMLFDHFAREPTVTAAAHWLCERLDVKPESLGWKSPEAQAEARVGQFFETLPEPSPRAAVAAEDEEEPFSMPIGGTNVPLISEDEAGILFAEEYRGKLRYCWDHGAWFHWDGILWRQNATNRAYHLVRELVRRMAESEPEKVRIAAGKATFSGGVERFARADPTFSVRAETWDQDPLLLGTPAGIIDLRTGLLRPARPEDGITKSTSVIPAETAGCPLWLRFLSETFGGDEEVVRFFRQWCGYSLTGVTREHALVFGFGPGGNGKSVAMNVLIGILAGYAATAAMETFISTGGGKHTTDLAMLRGARLVTASETEEGQQWAESRIKSITGGDPITARLMRQDNFTYTPQFKLTIIGNHKPGLRNVDEAMKRRFILLPFIHKPARPDRQLEAKLRTEWPAIFRWMIEGAQDWLAHGLLRPEGVQAATDTYFNEEDTIGQWLREHCLVDQSSQRHQATTQALFASWSSFARSVGEPIGTEKALAQRLEKDGFTRKAKVASSTGGRARGFAGIELRGSAFFEDKAA